MRALPHSASWSSPAIELVDIVRARVMASQQTHDGFADALYACNHRIGGVLDAHRRDAPQKLKSVAAIDPEVWRR